MFASRLASSRNALHSLGRGAASPNLFRSPASRAALFTARHQPTASPAVSSSRLQSSHVVSVMLPATTNGFFGFRHLLSRAQSASRGYTTATTTAAADTGAEGMGGRYSRVLATLHWLGAAGVVFCVVTAFIAGQIPNDKEKTSPGKLKFRGKLMHLHESVGMCMLALMVPRLAARLLTKLPAHVPGPVWQVTAANVTHFLLYGVLVFMPVSGFAFGYLSGWGVPFFFWDVPGDTKENAERPFNKKWEKFFYENHHRVGYYLTYFILPAHVGAVAFHYAFRGHNLLLRMNPFK